MTCTVADYETKKGYIIYVTYFEHSLAAGHGLNYGSLPTASALEGY